MCVISNKNPIIAAEEDRPNAVAKASDEWNGDFKIFLCVLCEEYLFLCPLEKLTVEKGEGGQTEIYLLDPPQIEKPQFFINVEFSSLKIIKNKAGIKCGFALTLRDIRHDLIIIN